MIHVLLSAILFLAPAPHIEHMAEYYYQYDGKSINLKFVIEKGEMMQFDFKDGCNMEDMTALCASNYLRKHTTIEVNGKKVALALQKSYVEGEHLVVLLTKEINEKAIKSIKVYNNCFYEFFPEYTNRIIINMGHFDKSYALSRHHKKIALP